jgi:hypothetical protein
VSLGVVVLYALFRFTGAHRNYVLYYDAPITAAFAAFVVERVVMRRRPSLVDATVITMSLARVLLPVPGYSGHALFSSYAALSSRGMSLRVIGLCVLVEVAAIKLFLWGDFVTLIGGAVIGFTAFSIHRAAQSEESQNRATRWRSLSVAFALGCCIALAFVFYQDRFDAARWQHDTTHGGGWDGYRTVRAARAAARRLRNASRGAACEMLDGVSCPPPPDAGPEIRYYELSEPCGSMFSITMCSFAVQLEGGRVAAAWLHDTDGAPWSIECLFGCDREDVRTRMEPR